ncbi:OadG family protein [Sunxiuqinia sp. A32]|uniref:OadG family protein n=1 Tax=Sunxiuqinia sp. A32 TaxID=3461496 RepID=UPI0040464004
MSNLIILTSTMDFGWTVALVGFFIVFVALTILVIVFLRLPKLINIKFKKKKEPRKKDSHCKDENECVIEGNVTAAISMALYLYFDEQHDEESNIVTIKKVRKAYSPWSSKIYSVTNNWPR